MEPVIWIIDHQQWPRAALRAELIERAFDAVGFIDIAHALKMRNVPGYAKPDLIVLELSGFPFERDELKALVRTGIPVIALGGAVELNDEFIAGLKWAAVLQRPFTIGRAADLIEELAKQ